MEGMDSLTLSINGLFQTGQIDTSKLLSMIMQGDIGGVISILKDLMFLNISRV